MLCLPLVNYLEAAQGLPFFCSVGNEDYCSFLNDLTNSGVKVIRVSEFCTKDDKFPDLDEMVDYFRTADVDYRENKYVVVGLGEYLALRGNDETINELNRLKFITLGNARVILLLRGIDNYVRKLSEDDKRLSEQGRIFISSLPASNISVTNFEQDVGIIKKAGIKWLIRDFEDGKSGNLRFSSRRAFDNSLIPYEFIAGGYSAIKYIVNGFSIPESFGTDDLWKKLLHEVQKSKNSLDGVFERFSINNDYERDLYVNCSGIEFKNWLYFIFLKINLNNIQSKYLAWVVYNTDDWSELKNNLLTFIVRLKHSDKDFKTMYDDRKRLLKNFPESDIAIFVKQNEIVPEEEIYHLTDNTPIERKKVISWVSRYGWSDEYEYVYPLLSAYLKKYVFDCGALSSELTDYFEQYKTQKITNKLSESFLAQVDDWGKHYRYSRIQTRDNAIKNIPDRQSSFLYWIDAMGVEYLSLILELAKKKGLSVRIDIGRAELPSLTVFNKEFYENWDGVDKYKEEGLDDIKHNDKGGFFFTDCEEPIHLESEIAIIEKAINIAATKLAMHSCKSFVIASDHGASRLAVIKHQEEKYSTETGGEHSGRCCKVFPNYDLPNCVEEKGYLVLTDYGRFKGSRAANVEVHGGASLEEVLVPIITLTLKKQGNINICILNEDRITADRQKGTQIQIYISEVEHQNEISLVIGDKKYKAIATDPTHYNIVLPDIRHAKKCEADVFDGDDLIGRINFKVNGKSGSINTDFDFDFDNF